LAQAPNHADNDPTITALLKPWCAACPIDVWVAVKGWVRGMVVNGIGTGDGIIVAPLGVGRHRDSDARGWSCPKLVAASDVLDLFFMSLDPMGSYYEESKVTLGRLASDPSGSAVGSDHGPRSEGFSAVVIARSELVAVRCSGDAVRSGDQEIASCAVDHTRCAGVRRAAGVEERANGLEPTEMLRRGYAPGFGSGRSG